MFGGKIIEMNNKLNKFIKRKEICFILFHDKRGNIRKERAIIDSKNYNLVKNYKWCFCHGYAYNSKNRIKLEHLILGISPNRKIIPDHINRNRLDNKETNLRQASKSQNAINCSQYKNSTSGIKGVYKDRSIGRCKWVSAIQFRRKQIHLGTFVTKKEAIHAYNKKAKELFGEFAFLNKI